MLLEVVKSKGLAHMSYFISDSGEAVVVDPRRDCSVYTRLARGNCARIRYILETHRNEDYVIGSIELKSVTEAEIAHSKELPFQYGDYSLSDGETLDVGNLKIKALHTPGHTDESMCYVVFEVENPDEPLMVFTGDTLFVGDVGRTDLYGPEKQREQSEKLYDSLHDKLMPLGDQTTFYPAHGAGSVCGHAISERESSTIGYEKRTNSVLRMSKDAFVEHLSRQVLLTPPYFRRMEIYNLKGPPLLSQAFVPCLLTVDELEKEMLHNNSVVVDTRDPECFAGSHIPASLNIWIEGASVFPGWVLTYDDRILLVTEREEDVDTARTYLYRLGFDNIRGFFCPGIREWRNQAKPVERLGILFVNELKQRLEERDILLIDVREPTEWDEGHIDGAQNIYVGHLAQEAPQQPREKPIATTCEWGGRGSLAASMLSRLGFAEVYNVLGGLKVWRAMDYPLVTE